MDWCSPMQEDPCPDCVENLIYTGEEDDNTRLNLLIIGVSAVLFAVASILEFILGEHLPALALYLVTTVISGYTIAKEGFSSLLRKRVTIDLLITLAALGAFLIGHGEEGAAVVFLFNLAEFLEDYAVGRARKSVHSLMKLAPEVAVVRRNGENQEVHVHSVDVGEVVLVRPGEKIPLDGVVIRGISSVNQAYITGESVPVTKHTGDEVYAGTINNEGALEVQVTNRSTETLLSKIVKLVEDAQTHKSTTESVIDKFSTYYTPTVILLALGVAIIPPLVLRLPFDAWIYRALVLLVVSCPCALAISTPVAMVSAIASAARNGVLIKGSNYVEEMSKIKVVAFDKTGTLTKGSLEVTDVIGLGYSRHEVLLKAACLEASSEHPIATAIVAQALQEGITVRDVHDFQAISGKGVTCAIDDKQHFLGNRRLFQELTIPFPEVEVAKLETEGKTVVLVGNTDHIIGLIAVRDEIRDTTIKSIQDLKNRGIRTEMVTGDNEQTAKAIATTIGIDEYHAELLPTDKVTLIGNHLSEDFGPVAMVGDGVNDAPALASANVGIAMGVAGSDVSLETADVTLMQDDLSKVHYLLELSKTTMAVVKQNVAVSLLIKGTFVILAFPGLVTLWLAVAIGDMGLSLAVILNALRLSLVKPHDN